MSRNAFRQLGALAFSALAVIGGCQGPAGSSASGAPVVAAAPGATSNPWLADERIAEAMAFRVKVGLRSDEAWARKVATDRAAVAGILSYNVPLLPDEVEAVTNRYADLHAILDVLDEYGALHPSEWAGATQDPSTNRVTARFTANLPNHQANLRNWLPPGARVNLVQVRWALRELDAVRERINDDFDSGWLVQNDIYPVGLGVDPPANQVALEVSSARADLDSFLELRYDASTMLTITSDGTGVRLMPKGTLAGVVVDAAGNPVAGVNIELTSTVAGAGPHGDMGYGTSNAGRFRIERIEAVTYTVLVFTDDPFDTRKLLGTSDPVTVVAGTTTNVRVVLP